MIIALNASAWGPKGHDTVAYIAEKHLSKRRLRECRRCSMVTLLYMLLTGWIMPATPTSMPIPRHGTM